MRYNIPTLITNDITQATVYRNVIFGLCGLTVSTLESKATGVSSAILFNDTTIACAAVVFLSGPPLIAPLIATVIIVTAIDTTQAKTVEPPVLALHDQKVI